MGATQATTQPPVRTSASAREVHVLVIDKDEALLSALWHALDSDGWQIRAADDPDMALPALASAEWTAVIANVAITGLQGSLFETLRALAEAPAFEEGHRRARVLFLVPEELALESRPLLESARLPYTFKPINLHDLLEKVSDLMLEAQALAAPIRRVKEARNRKRGAQATKVFNKVRVPDMFAARENYIFTEEELAEFDRAEAAARTASPERKKDPKNLGAPMPPN
jgi:DNA-binding response OmpR family regulator